MTQKIDHTHEEYKKRVAGIASVTTAELAKYEDSPIYPHLFRRREYAISIMRTGGSNAHFLFGYEEERIKTILGLK